MLPCLNYNETSFWLWILKNETIVLRYKLSHNFLPGNVHAIKVVDLCQASDKYR